MRVHDLGSNTIDVLIDITINTERDRTSKIESQRAATVRVDSSNALRDSVVEAFLTRKTEEGKAYGLPCRMRPASEDDFLSSMLVPSPGRVVGGRYILEAPLASGGMGSVWTAQHIGLDAPVAIKLMAPKYGASPQERARFMREARAAARLRSRNVVAVLDYGVDIRTQYIVMERLNGEDLWTRLNRERCMQLHEIARILDSIASALELAHGAGIVHRDVKPENIFLARVAGEAEEVVKVLDFGVAKELNPGIEDEKTPNGAVIGTPQYMSPEQATGMMCIDHRSDLWSLGVILFRAITGHLPFENRPFHEILEALLDGPIPSPSSLVPHLAAEVDRFFERALARDRSDRFQSAREMAEAFHRLVPGSTQYPRHVPLECSALELSSGDFTALSAPQLDAWACGRPSNLGESIAATHCAEHAIAAPASGPLMNASLFGAFRPAPRWSSMRLIAGALASLWRRCWSHSPWR